MNNKMKIEVKYCYEFNLSFFLILRWNVLYFNKTQLFLNEVATYNEERR